VIIFCIYAVSAYENGSDGRYQTLWVQINNCHPYWFHGLCDCISLSVWWRLCHNYDDNNSPIPIPKYCSFWGPDAIDNPYYKLAMRKIRIHRSSIIRIVEIQNPKLLWNRISNFEIRILFWMRILKNLINYLFYVWFIINFW
jgi:hypothetical protein